MTKLKHISDEDGRGFIIFGEVENCTFIFELMVYPDWRGQGVGTSLVQKAIELTGKPRVWFGKVSKGGMALARKFDPKARFRRLPPHLSTSQHTHVHLKPRTTPSA